MSRKSQYVGLAIKFLRFTQSVSHYGVVVDVDDSVLVFRTVLSRIVEHDQDAVGFRTFAQDRIKHLP